MNVCAFVSVRDIHSKGAKFKFTCNEIRYKWMKPTWEFKQSNT